MTSSRVQVAIAAFIFVVASALPFFLHNDYLLQVMFRVFLFAALGLAWNWLCSNRVVWSERRVQPAS